MVLRTRGFTNDEGGARPAAAKAIELDPNLADAHAAMALIKFSDWDWAGSEQETRRAFALNPEVDIPQSPLLTITGRHVEAIAADERGVRVDPLSSDRTTSCWGPLCTWRASMRTRWLR